MTTTDADIARYLHHQQVERRAAQRTLHIYQEALHKLLALSTDAALALRDVQAAHIRRWVATLHGRGLSPRTLALTLSAWRGFYRYLGREGVIKANPVEGIRAPKAAKPLPKALSVSQSMTLADHHQPDADPTTESRDRCLIEMLYGCGLRVSELAALDLHASAASSSWIDLQSAEATVLGKGQKRRTVPIGQSAMTALTQWLQHRSEWLSAASAMTQTSDQAALFLTPKGRRITAAQIRIIVKRRALQAGIPTDVHPHMLRHSFASHVLQSSSDLRGVQELLGHANITTTQIYTQLDFQHLAKVYDAAHPRAKKKSDT